MKVLVTGCRGQLGRSLVETAPENSRFSIEPTQVDITDADALAVVLKQARPDLIINAAAYTAVDDAETHQTLAFETNSKGPERLAQYAATNNVRLIHVSTDFVFSGNATEPYSPNSHPGPLSVYGRSKLDGEHAVLENLRDSAVVVRSAWLYSVFGRNFVLTMLRLMGEKDEIRVVGDQTGTPTWVQSLAEVIWKIADRPDISGVLHWTDGGYASWYEFAVAIQETAFTMGLLPRTIPVHKIGTTDYPTPAARPAYSVLNCQDTCRLLQIKQVNWKHNLRNMLEAYKNRV